MMLYYTERAEKDLAALDRKQEAAIRRRLLTFSETGEGDIKKLHGAFKGKHRLRVGDYRAMISLSGGDVVVLNICDRREAY